MSDPATAPAAPTERAPADAAQREIAVTESARNLCVDAGAGSGKTSLLIERLLHALLFRGIALERIVAITFMEKAAAEMRARLREALAEVVRTLADGASFAKASSACTTEARRALARFAREPWSRTIAPARVRERAAAAIDAPFALSTIHAFALGLLHRHPIEAELPAGVTMDLGDRFRRHAIEHFPRLVELALADAGTRAASAAVVARVELDELREFAERLAWLPEGGDDTGDALAVLLPRLAALERELRAARAQLSFGPKHVDTLVRQWDDLLAALAHVRTQPAAAGGRIELPEPLLETLFRKSLSDAKPAQTAIDLDRFKEQLKEAQRLLQAMVDADEPFVRLLVATVRPLARELRTSFTRGGAITADGALALAARLLAEHPAVRRAEADAIELLAVDEFQDTDPLQCELILFLCEDRRTPPVRRAEQVALAPGKLFLVGDPKQSIYRFRGADLDVYARAKERLLSQDGVPVALTTSFRSPPELVEPVNVLFGAWTDASNDAEPAFLPLVSHGVRTLRTESGAPAPAVEIVAVRRDDGQRAAEPRREAEGRTIAQEIERLHAAGIGYGRIVLLLRQLTGLRHYVQPLRDRAIPFVLAGGKTFVQRSEVGELASLLLAAADPHDEGACLGALRSTLLAVPDAAIFAAKRERGTLRWRELLGASDPAVGAAAQRLAAFHDELRTRPVAAAVERFVERSPLLPIAALARDGDQRIANLRKLAEMASARAMDDGLTLAEAVREIVANDERVEGDSERSLADEEVDAVRILTIHRAKGLEFDVVIVGDLARGESASRSQRVAAAPAGGAGLAIELPQAQVRSLAQVVRSERDRLHEQAERKRLFYVALTRAKQRLLLVVGEHDKGTPPWVEPLAALAGHPDVARRELTMPARVHARRSLAPADLVALAAATTAFEDAIARAQALPIHFERPSQHDDAAEIGWRADDAADGAMRERGRTPRDLARCVGIACHLALARSGPTAAPDAATIAAAAAAAAEDGVDPARVAAEAQSLLAAAPARALLQALTGVRALARELPLTLARDGRLWRGTADLVFEEAGGRIVVADWKSDQEGVPAELERRYRGQLEIYRDALQTAWRLARPPAIELLLLRHGRRLAL